MTLVHGSSENGGSDPWGPITVDGCIVRDGRDSADSEFQSTFKIDGTGTIVRGCFVRDGTGSAVSSAATPGGFVTGDTIKHQRFYNNTIINCGSALRLENDGFVNSTINFKEQYYFNNIFYDMDGTHKEADKNGGNPFHFYWDTNNYSSQGYPNGWFGAQWRDNIFHDPVNSFAAQMRGANGTGASTQNVAGMESLYPAVWSNNEERTASLNFVNENDLDNVTIKDSFRLTGGTGVGDGAAHTTVATTANSTTVLDLEDHWWIYDGYDLSYFTKDGFDYGGDYIKVGANTVRVLDVDYFGTGQVTIDQAINVTAGDPVYLVSRDGVTVWDNKGAAQ